MSIDLYLVRDVRVEISDIQLCFIGQQDLCVVNPWLLSCDEQGVVTDDTIPSTSRWRVPADGNGR